MIGLTSHFSFLQDFFRDLTFSDIILFLLNVNNFLKYVEFLTAQGRQTLDSWTQ